MKKIIGLDLGTTSIGWAVVNEAENEEETSSITRLGVRLVPLTADEQNNFETGESITTNSVRTKKRSMRRNLQRFKLRRENLIECLTENNIIKNETILCEDGNRTTFQTYRDRAKAAVDEISLDAFARVLLMINKKRGYKSNRKVKSAEDVQQIDGMAVAKELYERDITPGMFVLELLKSDKRYLPDFYRSDLIAEMKRIWHFQKQFHADILTDDFYEQLQNKDKKQTESIFRGRYQIFSADNKEKDKYLQAFTWRANAVGKQLTREELAYVIADVNEAISRSSGNLGYISDRSKELALNHQTVGQYIMNKFEADHHFSIKNKTFYRQDYLDEFETIWETQAKHHKQLTPELKKEIRDIIIFYQRPLKSQKGSIDVCYFENRQVTITEDGKTRTKTVGAKVLPKSSPLFQEFKIWQVLNNIKVTEISSDDKRHLYQEEKELLFNELNIKKKLTKSEALKLLFAKPRSYNLNYDEIEGNRTLAEFYSACQRIIAISGHGEYNFQKMSATDINNVVQSIFTGLGFKTDFLTFDSSIEGHDFEKQPMYRLWHLLYSYEGDNSKTGNKSLIDKICLITELDREYANIFANISIQQEYGSLSAKAVRKILPEMKKGNEYSIACKNAGYRHSDSLTREELECKEYKSQLDLIPRNSLRNPVVEKILNQMINVVNELVNVYGRPDEIRIEMARELQKSAGKRKEMSKALRKGTARNEQLRKEIETKFGIKNVTRNDILRYRLYLELAPNGFKTLYSNTYIPEEKVFSKEFDIEHIIPQARLFDDSFSNKTLEARQVNIDKSNKTAIDFISERYGESYTEEYKQRINNLMNSGNISRAKRNKLLMTEADIPNDFIDRDLRNSQYIARKAREILLDMCMFVNPTIGSITTRLREDWQLIDVMQEINWDKYERLGLTESITDHDGKPLHRIKDWTKRNDHRHHAMDALTIAFTRPAFVQYLNNLNARSDKSSSIYAIEKKYLERDKNGKLRFIAPMPLTEFRQEAKRKLQDIIISIKAKNKVATQNVNVIRTNKGKIKHTQLTPRGQLHNDNPYGHIQRYVTREVKVNGSFDERMIALVSKKVYREALTARLHEFNDDPKKAFTGKNSLEKAPIWLDKNHTWAVPQKVKITEMQDEYPIRKEITPELKIEKVIDAGIRAILQKRLDEFAGDAQKAFSNLSKNPIWLNKEAGIQLKRVRIKGIANALAIHSKKNHKGEDICTADGNKQAVDFINTNNNHHIAIFSDENGKFQEHIVSFLEATERKAQGIDVIDKNYRKEDGWTFEFTMKQNEMFVFPNPDTGFDPSAIDLTTPDNYALISPNLYRVQTISTNDYIFRHHLETNVEKKELLKNIAYKRIYSRENLKGAIKVRVNHIGQIVEIGEY